MLQLRKIIFILLTGRFKRPVSENQKKLSFREVLAIYHEGIIALSACLKGEVAYNMIHQGYEAARKVALKYRELFGDDYYLEIQWLENDANKNGYDILLIGEAAHSNKSNAAWISLAV